MVKLTNEEIVILKDFIEIKRAYSMVIEQMDILLTKDSHTEEDRRQMALLTYKKLCIEKLEKYYFCQDKIMEREKVNLDELIKS